MLRRSVSAICFLLFHHSAHQCNMLPAFESVYETPDCNIIVKANVQYSLVLLFTILCKVDTTLSDCLSGDHDSAALSCAFK